MNREEEYQEIYAPAKQQGGVEVGIVQRMHEHVSSFKRK
jgi:hypothetical protein